MMGSVPNKPKTKPRNVRIEDDLWSEALAIAKASGTNVSEVIRSFLESYVERNRALRTPRSMPDEIKEMLSRFGIPESSVADWSVDVNYSHMWRTKAAWPAGGTYEAENPRGFDDEMVARKATTQAELTVLNPDRTALERAERFEILPVSSDDQPNLYRLVVIDRGQWEFFDK